MVKRWGSSKTKRIIMSDLKGAMFNRIKMLQGMAAATVAASLLLASSHSSAAEHGMNENVLSQIPQNLQAIIDRGQSSGMVTLVARNGKIASIDAVGWQIMDKEQLETTDVFWAASITKPFVAVAIMMMVDKGHLQLDDLVEKHIPEFKG